MVQPIPGSLSEGAVERSETEGVYCDERKRSKVSEPIKNCEETTSPEQPSDDTPSVTPCGRASSLREGAGKRPPITSITRPLTKHQRAGDFWGFVWGWVLPFNRVLRNRGVGGQFSSPLRSSECLTAPIQRTTLPQSASLTAPSEREPGRGAYHSSGYSLNRGVTGDFHRPYETRNV